MKIAKERSVVASYGIGVRARSQLRNTVETQRDLRVAFPIPAPSAQLQMEKIAQLSVQINQQSSSVQSALAYLQEVAELLDEFKRGLRDGANASSGAVVDENALSRLVVRLNRLLDDRSQRSGSSLDAQLNLKLDEPLRSRFTIKGLESMQAVQASGSETLLFNTGRYLPGPIAVVLDDDMPPKQLLYRINSALSRAGIHVQLAGADQLSFSADEVHWRKLKDQLSVQGEDKLFRKDGFTPIDSQKDNLLGAPLAVPKCGREETKRLISRLDKALQHISGVVDQLNRRQAESTEQLRHHESKDEQRWAHDVVGRLFQPPVRQNSPYSRVAEIVLSQAQLSQHGVVGVLG